MDPNFPPPNFFPYSSAYYPTQPNDQSMFYQQPNINAQPTATLNPILPPIQKNNSVAPENLVWAKASKPIPWPAMILDLDSLAQFSKLERKPHFKLVRFFGFYEIAYIHESFISQWRDRYYEKRKKSRAKLFVQAVNEAKEYASTQTLPDGWRFDDEGLGVDDVVLFTESGEEVPGSRKIPYIQSSKSTKKSAHTSESAGVSSGPQSMKLISEHQGFKPLSKVKYSNANKYRKRRERQIKLMRHLGLAPLY